MRSHGQLGLDADLLDSKHGTDYLTKAEHTSIGTGTPHHDPVTLGGGSDAALALSGQQLTLRRLSYWLKWVYLLKSN